MTSTPEQAAPITAAPDVERAVRKPLHDGIYVPLHSWWMSKTGERFFCIVGLGFDSRDVLEFPRNGAISRPLAELKRLIREGYWLPVYEE